MARILAVTWDGGGNVPPMLDIAAELQGRGHDVRVLGHPQQRDTVEEAGLAFVAYRQDRPWSPLEPTRGARFVSKFLFAVFTDPKAGDDVRAELARLPADLALVDSMRLGALRAALASGVPTAVLMHTLHRYHTHGWSRGPVGAVATLRGMRPGRLWNAAERVLVATDRDLDPAAKRHQPGNVRYTGVVHRTVRTGTATERPLVLVSLSTIYFEGQAAALQAILTSMDTLPVRAVVTTGPVDPDTVTAPGNVELYRYLPHDEIMPLASLVVGHGGHATTMRALAHGLPLLLLPMHPLLDQPMIAKAVSAAGAARILPKTARPGEIRGAISALLGEGPHRAAAAAIGARIRRSNGRALAADELEGLLKLRHKAAQA